MTTATQETIETQQTGPRMERTGIDGLPHEPQFPLWLSAGEAETLLYMCSMSPASGGDLEESLFQKLGRLLSAFETPRPKEL